MPPQLSFIGTGTPLSGTTQADTVALPSPQREESDLVAELLASLDVGQPEAPPKVGVGRRILGALGDAITASASVRAGGAPPRIGAFAASQLAQREAFAQRSAAADTENRRFKQSLLLQNFKNQAADRRLRTGGGTNTKDVTTRVTQQMVDELGFPQSSLGEIAQVRDRIDKRTGITISREFLGFAAKPKLTTKEFETTITEDMVKRHGLPRESVGTFARVRDTLDPDGMTTKREILGPGVDPTRPLVTTEGFFPLGTKTGKVGEVLISPITGERLKPFQEEMFFLRQQVIALNKKRQFQLPSGILRDLTEEGIGVSAASAALRRYIDLGSPDLAFPFTLVQGTRFEAEDRTTARRVISEAVVPIRKFFSGAAVTPTEAQASAPLIANLEQGVAPNILTESLIGLVNISRRARQRILLDARANGLDISGFESELSSGELSQIESLEEFLAGGKPAGLQYFIDENGNLKIEE